VNAAGGPISDEIEVLILWSSGGSLICLDGDTHAVRWWRETPGFSGSDPVVCEITGNGSPELLLLSPFDEITVVDVATGRIGPRLKKYGSDITDFKVMDADGDGRAEILAAFKDEGIYVLNPRPLGREDSLDIVLDLMDSLGGAQ
jgi:hypothetical protein